MGTIKKGILGGFSGKVGTVVGASWKGIDYIRSMPLSVRNPKTIGQLKQRGRFSLVVKFVSTILPVVSAGFRQSAGAGKSAYTAAVSYNINNAVVGEYPMVKLDFAKVAVARGALYGANTMTTACEGGGLTFTWGTEVFNNASSNDALMVLAYNPERNEAAYNLSAGIRSEGTASLALPPAWDGEEVETFAAFISEDARMASDTLYGGKHAVVLG